jgi:hypothetical protein
MKPYTARFTAPQQQEAQDRNLAARRFMYSDPTAQQPGKLWIAGNSNQFVNRDEEPLNDDPGNMMLSLEGQLADKNILTNISGQIKASGMLPPEEAQSFALRDQGFQYGFSTQKAGDQGKKTTTKVLAASLTDKDCPDKRASFIRLINEDGSFINKVYSNDNRVIEMRFKADGTQPSQISIDLDQSDGKYKTDWKDLTSEEGQNAVMALGAGQDPENPNGRSSRKLESFCQFINLHPEALFYRLGVREKNEAELNHPDEPQNYE